MIANRFAPGIALTATVLAALSILIGLGTWQALKVGPKTELLARIEAGLKAEAIKLPLHVDDPLSLEYRAVSFSGTVIGTKPARVYGINLDGKPGYYIYAPVKRPHGMAVIVNFGWVPLEHKKRVILPVGVIEVSGVLMRSATPGQMALENNAEKGLWYTADVYGLAAHFGLHTKEFYHFRIFADHQGQALSLPRGGQFHVDIPNNHFQYALTWYGLGLSLLAVYIAFGMQKARKADE